MTSINCACAVFGVAFLAHGVPATSNAFLRRADMPVVSHEVTYDFEKILLAEIEEAFSLGGQEWRAAQGRAVHIKEALRPTFVSMPKNEHGKLDHAAVRYVLHRLFVARHGWFIQGLQPDGSAWDSANTSGVLHDQVPEQVQVLFEKRMGSQGLGLEELTVLAATLEHLVHNEVSGHIRALFATSGHPQTEGLRTEDAQELIDAQRCDQHGQIYGVRMLEHRRLASLRYMAVYLLGGNVSDMSSAQVSTALRSIKKIYPTWNETQKFVRDVYSEVVPGGSTSSVQFTDVVKVAEEVGERYGRWQNAECVDLKNKLASYGDQVTGRVRLGDFYGGAVNDGHYQFSESIAYLREIGALDESDMANPRVIIPNYINGPSNCVASSSYYSVCCINECEELMGHLEENLGAPDGSPAEITALVTALPSATRAAGRNLSTPLLSKLQDVADHHGGRIALHGRLFMQWMHVAYPMECPYPHLSGTATPMTSAEWYEQTGTKTSATKEEMDQHMSDASADENASAEEGVCGMWNMQEELVAGESSAVASRRRSSGAFRSFFQGIMLFAAVASMASAAIRIMVPALSGMTKDGLEKCVV